MREYILAFQKPTRAHVFFGVGVFGGFIGSIGESATCLHLELELELTASSCRVWLLADSSPRQLHGRFRMMLEIAVLSGSAFVGEREIAVRAAYSRGCLFYSYMHVLSAEVEQRSLLQLGPKVWLNTKISPFWRGPSARLLEQHFVCLSSYTFVVDKGKTHPHLVAEYGVGFLFYSENVWKWQIVLSRVHKYVFSSESKPRLCLNY